MLIMVTAIPLSYGCTLSKETSGHASSLICFPTWQHFRQASMRAVTTLYYLLYARYGNSHIASSDENQFTYKMWSIVFQYGPSWSKRLDIQAKVRALTDAELERGTQAIYNSANNPEVAPSTSALEELPYISNQNTTNYKKSKIDALNEQWAMLSTDVSEEFLGRFKNLFLTIVQPEAPMYFISKEESN